jgi:hypothetical protein
MGGMGLPVVDWAKCDLGDFRACGAGEVGFMGFFDFCGGRARRSALHKRYESIGSNLALTPAIPQTSLMQASRAHLAIAFGSAGLLVLVFLGYLYWLSTQPPVLSRSEERDPLTQMPISITMNPFRDRTIERTANLFIAQMRDGNCRQLLAQWERDYRKKRADFVCASEIQHPLISWNLVEWEDAPPLVILHYKGERYSSPAQESTYKDLFSVTEEKKDEGGWTVTKYDSFY